MRFAPDRNEDERTGAVNILQCGRSLDDGTLRRQDRLHNIEPEDLLDHPGHCRRHRHPARGHAVVAVDESFGTRMKLAREFVGERTHRSSSGLVSDGWRHAKGRLRQAPQVDMSMHLN